MVRLPGPVVRSGWASSVGAFNGHACLSMFCGQREQFWKVALPKLTAHANCDLPPLQGLRLRVQV